MSNLELVHKASYDLKFISQRPFIESQWILSSVLQKPLSEIYEFDSSQNQIELFLKKIQARKTGWPLAYLLKEIYFFKHSFYIEPGVFIPRPESELIISEILNLNLSHLKILDFGSGSGALAISLLKALPCSEAIAIEISSQSLKCLQKNKKRFQLQNRLFILNQDISSLKQENVTSLLKNKANLIVANPPYVNPQDRNLKDEVRYFEPPLSLFSGEEGMSHIYNWFSKAMELLQEGGLYAFEFAYNQEEKVCLYLDKIGCKYKIIKDEQGLGRIALCWKIK